MAHHKKSQPVTNYSSSTSSLSYPTHRSCRDKEDKKAHSVSVASACEVVKRKHHRHAPKQESASLVVESCQEESSSSSSSSCATDDGCPVLSEFQAIGADLVVLASQLRTAITALTALPATLSAQLITIATAISNVGIALQTSPCCDGAESVFALLNCILMILVNLLFTIGSTVDPTESFGTVLAILTRIQCVLTPLTGSDCNCNAFGGSCNNSHRRKRSSSSASASASASGSASAATSAASRSGCCDARSGHPGKSTGRAVQCKLNPCALICQAVFQTLASFLAFVAAVLSFVAGLSVLPPFVSLATAATALINLATAIITPDNSILSCCSSNTLPCSLPCTVGSALTAAIPIFTALAATSTFGTVAGASTLINAVQNALSSLTSFGCLGGVLSAYVNVSASLQGALVGFLSAVNALILVQ